MPLHKNVDTGSVQNKKLQVNKRILTVEISFQLEQSPQKCFLQLSRKMSI